MEKHSLHGRQFLISESHILQTHEAKIINSIIPAICNASGADTGLIVVQDTGKQVRDAGGIGNVEFNSDVALVTFKGENEAGVKVTSLFLGTKAELNFLCLETPDFKENYYHLDDDKEVEKFIKMSGALLAEASPDVIKKTLDTPENDFNSRTVNDSSLNFKEENTTDDSSNIKKDFHKKMVNRLISRITSHLNLNSKNLFIPTNELLEDIIYLISDKNEDEPHAIVVLREGKISTIGGHKLLSNIPAELALKSFDFKKCTESLINEVLSGKPALIDNVCEEHKADFEDGVENLMSYTLLDLMEKNDEVGSYTKAILDCMAYGHFDAIIKAHKLKGAQNATKH